MDLQKQSNLIILFLVGLLLAIGVANRFRLSDMKNTLQRVEAVCNEPKFKNE